MRNPYSGVRIQKTKNSRITGMPIFALIFSILVFVTFSFSADKDGKWEGVDKAVVERIAKEQGREAAGPLINTEQGDLMLFLFLTAGGIGGFCAGYCYRMLTERKSDIGKKAA